MTDVLVWLTRPALAGGREGTCGSLICTYSRRRNVGPEIVVPESFIAPLDADGKVTLHADPTDDTFYLTIVEDVPRGRHRFVEIPDSVDPVNYADLVDVDPTTDDPTTPPQPIWLTAVAGLIAEPVDQINGQLDGRLSDASLEATINDVADAAIAEHVPGSQLAYAEKLTSTVVTATKIADAIDIPGLSIPVVGTGRPVDVEFYAPSIVHTVANTLCFAQLIVNGATAGAFSQRGQSRSSGNTTSKGAPLYLKRSLTLVAGTPYTFTVRLYSDSVAGSLEAYAQVNLMAVTLEAIAR